MEHYPILLEEQTKHGHASFPCAVYQVDASPDNAEKIYCHWHKELELLLILEGSATLQVGPKAYPISSGSFIFVPSNAVHMVSGEQPGSFRFIAVVFHPDFIRSFGNDVIQESYLTPLSKWCFDCPFVINEADEYKNLILDICSIYAKEEKGYELFIKARLLELCYRLYQYAEKYQSHEGNSRNYHTSFIKEMMLYLQEHCTEAVSLTEMSKFFHISKGHLCRIFKEMTNMTPIDYLNYYRVNKSAQLLRETNLEISAVAGLAGFNNISYYNRTFRKYMHSSPGEYRRSNMTVTGHR